MKVAHVVAHATDEAMGTTYTVTRLCESLAAQGHEVELHALAAPPLDGVSVHEYDEWRVGGPLGLSPRLGRSLREVASRVDIIHSHGLWMLPNLYAARARRREDARHVVSPRGMLDPFALRISGRRKSAMWRIWQERALQEADLIHATSEAEAESIRSMGVTPPVAVVLNGIDIPEPTHVSKERVVLYLGRLHRIKRLDRLVQAWTSLESEFPGWSLRIVGPAQDVDHVSEVRAIIERCRAASIHPPVYAAEKVREYQRAAIFVLPTDTENFGMVVAEALAAGTPVIVTEGAPWSRVVAEGCGWWVERSVEAVATALESAMTLPLDELAAMGARGREWMSREFSWDSVARSMTVHYETIL